MQSAEYRAQRIKSRSGFQRLIVWQKSQRLAVEIIKIVDSLPSRRSTPALANQIIRSSTSIAANIAEGYGRYSEAAYRNHLSIARGSLAETLSWLNLLFNTGHLAADRADQLMDVCEISRMLTAAMKPLKPATRTTVREEKEAYLAVGFEDDPDLEEALTDE